MADDIKIAEEKAAEEKATAEAKAEAEAKERESKVKIENGLVTMPVENYQNLTGMKDDMKTYKERMRIAEKEVEDKKKADLKAKEEQLKKDKEFEELYKSEQDKNTDMVTKFKNQEIDNAIIVKAMKEGIKKGEYVKLIDKSKVTRDDDSGKISGVDEVMESFKKDNPDLFGSDEKVPGVDTQQGGHNSGVLSDDDLRALSGKDLQKLKAEDPRAYERWKKIATHGKVIPEIKEE